MIKFEINKKEWRFIPTNFDNVQKDYRAGKVPVNQDTYVHGYTDYMGRLILVADDAHPDQIKATIRHELIHAYIHSVGMNADSLNECQVGEFYAAAVDTIEPLVKELIRYALMTHEERRASKEAELFDL